MEGAIWYNYNVIVYLRKPWQLRCNPFQNRSSLGSPFGGAGSEAD